jgi:hypothetical protein
MSIGAKDQSKHQVAGSHRSFPQDSRRIEFVKNKLHLVKIMIRRFGRETLSTYCQTLNGCVIGGECIKASSISIKCPLCGPFLVSRIGDAG